MKNNELKKLSDKQMETISGGNYYTWRCRPSSGSNSGGGSGGPQIPSFPSVNINIVNNINIAVVNVIGNNLSNIDINIYQSNM